MIKQVIKHKGVVIYVQNICCSDTEDTPPITIKPDCIYGKYVFPSFDGYSHVVAEDEFDLLTVHYES